MQEKCYLDKPSNLNQLLQMIYFLTVKYVFNFKCLNNISQNVNAILERRSEESSVKIIYYISYIQNSSKVRIQYCC